MRGTGVTQLSIAAPAYNEAAGIADVVREWSDYLTAVPTISDFEIVICNDGSADATGAILDELAAGNPHVRPVHHPKNRGAAAALTTAIKHTRYPWVLLTDSDGQYGIENIVGLTRAVEETGGDAAIGVRLAKRDGAFTQYGSRLSGWLCNTFHGTHYRDFNCAFKLVSGSVLRSLTLEARGLNYSGEISSKLIERGVVMAEVEVAHRPRVSGRSSSQTLRAARHRMLFVLYIGIRQFLLRSQVLQVCS